MGDRWLSWGDEWLKLGRWMAVGSAPACYGSSLVSNPDISQKYNSIQFNSIESQKYKMGDRSKGVANTLWPAISLFLFLHLTFILYISYLYQGSPMVISMVAGLLAETGRIQVRLMQTIFVASSPKFRLYNSKFSAKLILKSSKSAKRGQNLLRFCFPHTFFLCM